MNIPIPLLKVEGVMKYLVELSQPLLQYISWFHHKPEFPMLYCLFSCQMFEAIVCFVYEWDY